VNEVVVIFDGDQDHKDREDDGVRLVEEGDDTGRREEEVDPQGNKAALLGHSQGGPNRLGIAEAMVVMEAQNYPETDLVEVIAADLGESAAESEFVQRKRLPPPNHRLWDPGRNRHWIPEDRP